ncbi:hypothetical protein LSAT2_013001 [Lamellibrachia satsuma]|nr:hypothetical protein LSAT2_013001 [Lamellibrachia satsuma]
MTSSDVALVLKSSKICCWACFTKHSYRSKELMLTFHADYVSHSNNRKHANLSDNPYLDAFEMLQAYMV